MTKIAVYGLSTETERKLPGLKEQYHVIGLLDGFRTDGELYGQPVIPFEKAVEEGVERIVVVARPGSCKAIARRIGDACKELGIALQDLPQSASYTTLKASRDTVTQSFWSEWKKRRRSALTCSTPS